MRTRSFLVPVLAGALLLTACGDGGDATDDATDAAGTEAPTAGATDGATAPADQPTSEDLVAEDLPDGVAATVGDTDIPVEAMQARVDAMRQIPQVQEQLEAEGGEQLEGQLQSQALGQLVLQEVVLQGAAEQDVEVGDDEVDAYRSELTESAGGEDAFAEQLATAGVPDDQLDQELRASLAFELVTEQLLADAGVEPTESTTEDGTAPPTQDPQAQQVQQQWLVQLVSETDVVVDEEYGAWDPNAGQVVAA